LGRRNRRRRAAALDIRDHGSDCRRQIADPCTAFDAVALIVGECGAAYAATRGRSHVRGSIPARGLPKCEEMDALPAVTRCSQLAGRETRYWRPDALR